MSTEPTGEEDVTALQGADQPTDSTADQLMTQILKDRRQKYGQRAVLFKVVIGVVITAILAVIGLMTWLIAIDRTDGDMLFAVFISGMTIQAFALVTIIARHLYPSSRGQSDTDQNTPT